MTKYVGVAKASRSRRLPGSQAADKRIALAMHALTGVHPEQEEVTEGTALHAEPEASRSQVHFTFAVDGAPLEPVVVQLFDDRVPASAREFRARAIGAVGRVGEVSYEGMAVTCVAAGLRVDVGAAPGGERRPAALEDGTMRHDQPGLVSMTAGLAPRFTFTLAPAMELDGRQQPVGRVVSGLGALEQLSNVDADGECKPLHSVLVCSCGAFGSTGTTARALALAAEAKAQARAKEAAQKTETPAETHARLELESSAARGAVNDAVLAALQASKRQRTSDAGTTFGRGRMLDSLLPPSDDDSEGSGEDAPE